jgi:hypothetical protein
MNDRLEAALDYRERGWVPFPAHGKEPHHRLIASTRGRSSVNEIYDHPPGLEELRSWFNEDPGANVALITDREPTVLDVDTDMPAGLELPRTLTARTARGRHFYLRSDQPVRRVKAAWGELRGHRQYVIAPTSRHPDGGDYRFDDPTVPLASLADVRWPADFNFAPHVATRETDFPTYLKSRARGTSSDCLSRVSRARPSKDRIRALGASARVSGIRLYDQIPFAAAAMCEALGIPLAGGNFRCVIHPPDRNRSCQIWREPGGRFIYRDFHAVEGQETFSFAGVRARLAGRIPKGPSELYVWKLRLLHEAGLLEPVRFEQTSDPFAEQVLLLFGLRWAWELEDDVPAPLNCDFVAAWTGIPRAEAYARLNELRRDAFFTRVGRDQRTHLWLPLRFRKESEVINGEHS